VKDRIKETQKRGKKRRGRGRRGKNKRRREKGERKWKRSMREKED